MHMSSLNVCDAYTKVQIQNKALKVTKTEIKQTKTEHYNKINFLINWLDTKTKSSAWIKIKLNLKLFSELNKNWN